MSAQISIGGEVLDAPSPVFRVAKQLIKLVNEVEQIADVELKFDKMADIVCLATGKTRSEFDNLPVKVYEIMDAVTVIIDLLGLEKKA